MKSSQQFEQPAERLAERKWMVETQLRSRGIWSEAVLQGMLAVPRHYFVNEEDAAFAYEDAPLAIGQGQTISQPYIVALMAQCLELSPTDRVLEIGTGSGYSAAVLAHIAAWVYTIERHLVLAQQAEERFRRLAYYNIGVRLGDGTLGWPTQAPFEAILVTAGGPVLPKPLLEQLAQGGRLVMPVGGRAKQELIRIRKTSLGGFEEEHLGAVRFVPLIGEVGWRDQDDGR